MTPAPTSTPDTSDREIVISRVFFAPRELVWEAWTNPQHDVNWWGPRGFTTTIERMDVRPGGVWEHTMRGPDGANYPNKSVFKEVVKPERIVFAHGGRREGGPGVGFVSTWTFEVVETTKTKVTIRMVFPSAADRDFVVKEFGAIEGGNQTLMRLSEHIAAQLTEPFIISREFAAPRDLVWKVWTEGEHFAQWFGPKGVATTLVQFDLRPGGMCHYYLTTPEGKKWWGKAAYREIVAPTKLVWINSFSDEHAGVTRHPFSKDPWPLHMLTTITFAEHASRTTVTVNWLPIDATAEEIKTFDAARSGMSQGWGGTFEQLKDYLAKT